VNRASCLVLLLAACGRVEEPPPGPGPRPIHIDATQAPPDPRQPRDASTSRVEPPLSPTGACVKPLPDKPERSLRKGPDPNCPADPDKQPKLDKQKITFTEAKFSITAEVTKTLEERARGLMYRKSLDDDKGMLFVFDDYRRHPFWMKNTCLSLDMIWLDQNRKIVGIEENTTPLDESSYDPGCPSAYVIEVAAGWARRHGVKPGQTVELDAK